MQASWRAALFCAAKWFVLSRLFILIVTSLYAAITENTGYYSHMYDYWAKWDAPHYLGLIKNWYVNEGDPRFHIVFFPMYPFVCKLLLPLFGGNADLSAMIVSNVCGYGAGAILYMLAALDHGRKGAGRAVKFFFLNPLSFFLSIPYTESLFLFLTKMPTRLLSVPLFHSVHYSALQSGRLCPLHPHSVY